VLVLYASVMTGLSALIAELGATVARRAAHVLSFAENPDQPASRVERGLEAQARVTEWQPVQPVSHVVELRAAPPSSQASAVVLASEMDAAEDADLSKPQPRSSPAPSVKPVKPRVAGWIRRAVRMSPPRNAVAESTADLIQRHLRAEM
jgi:hypothetical protein